MGAALRHLIAENYESFCTSFSKSESGGLMNYLFEPETNQVTGDVTLKMSTLDMNGMVSMLKDYFLSSKVMTRVLDVLPEDVRLGASTGDRQYFRGLIGGGVAIILSILIYVAALITPCAFRCGKKRAQDGFSKAKSIVYLVFAILTMLLVIFLALAIPVSYVASQSFVDSIKGEASGGGKSELSQRIDVVFNETKAFMKEMINNGSSITDKTVATIQAAVQEEISPVIQFMMDGLMEDYGANKISNRLEAMNNNVDALNRTAAYVGTNSSVVSTSITNFQSKMNQHTTNLETSLNKLCNKSPPPPDCDKMKAEVQKLKLNFDPDALLTGPSQHLASFTNTIGTNLKIMSKNFTNMKNQMQAESEKLAEQLKANLNFKEQLDSLSKIWDNLRTNLAGPVEEDLDKSRPEIDKYLKLAGVVGTAVGYAFAGIFSVTVLIMLIYVIVCLVDAIRQGFWPFGEGGGSAMPKLPACGFLLPVLLSILTPIIVLIAVLLILVTIVLNNEVCRYVTKPSAIRITSATLDLYLKHEWPTLMPTGSIQPEFRDIINLPPPQGALEGILICCEPNEENHFAPPFLPILGVQNIVNVTAVMQNEEIQKAIAENKQNAVDTVNSLDLDKLLPPDTQNTINNLTEVANNISAMDIQGPIKALEAAVPEKEPFIRKLDDISNKIPPVSGDQDVADIKNTINKMKTELDTIDAIQVHIKELSNAFKVLEDFKKFSEQLKQFATELQEVYNVLKDKQKIEQPINKVYDAAVEQTFCNLSQVIEKQTLEFTANVVSCGRVNTALNTAIGAGCAQDGIINRLGGFLFMLLLIGVPMLFTILIFQIFLGLHQEQCQE